MNHKVLLADDSVTIQKVIKITLANQPYDITDASSENDLFTKLKSLDPKLVLLDFNLSEKFSGYELTSKIKSICPNTKVLLLLGTFDTVENEAMLSCGASDKIVKPFDSNKFIAICRQLVDSDSSEDIPYPQEKLTLTDKDTNQDEQWEVSHSTEQKLPGPKISSVPNEVSVENPLIKEVSSWGMSVPGVIQGGKDSDNISGMPPVIGAQIRSLNEQKVKKDEAKYPQNEDLDYPTIEDTIANEEGQSLGGTADDLIKSTTSKVISIETFNEELLELELQQPNQMYESDVKNIEAQILDEVQDDLWKVDEFEDLKKEVASKIDESKKNFQPTLNDFDESLFKPVDDNSSITWTDTTPSSSVDNVASTTNQPLHSFTPDQGEVRIIMEEMVKKYVKEYMDQMFQKNTEKVAWEVIPDLAENLIRQELSKISHKILNDQG